MPLALCSGTWMEPRSVGHGGMTAAIYDSCGLQQMCPEPLVCFSQSEPFAKVKTSVIISSGLPLYVQRFISSEELAEREACFEIEGTSNFFRPSAKDKGMRFEQRITAHSNKLLSALAVTGHHCCQGCQLIRGLNLYSVGYFETAAMTFTCASRRPVLKSIILGVGVLVILIEKSRPQIHNVSELEIYIWLPKWGNLASSFNA